MIDPFLNASCEFALFVLLSCRFEWQEAVLVTKGWTCLGANRPSSKVRSLGVKLGFAKTGLAELPTVYVNRP
jgi:hypothetical protein